LGRHYRAPRSSVRPAECHQDRKHFARGLCKGCYVNLLKRMGRVGGKHSQGRTVWPQAVVRVPVKGWGCL
jgi:hypothetical protein